MIKGRGSIFHFLFLPSASSSLKIVLDSGKIAQTECNLWEAIAGKCLKLPAVHSSAKWSTAC